MKLAPFAAASALLATSLLGCSSSTPENTAQGGTTSASGASNSGGATTAGGASNSGGSASGGVNTSGGTTTTAGGITSLGGSSSVPGGTSNASGGVNSSGGAAPSAGAGASQGGTAGSPVGGGTALGGTGGTAGNATGGSAPVGVMTYPDLPGAIKSPLYTLTANGTPVFVEKMTKFAPEMQVHYAHLSLAGTAQATFTVNVNETFTNFTVSPKSRKLNVSKSGNAITFASGANYLILQFDSKELLFILIDAPEVNPPRLGDPNVKSIADYDVDATGATLVTTKVQAAIDAASGAAQNILYFPPGKYLVGELWLKSNMTLYLAGGALLYGSNRTADFTASNGNPNGIDIEGCSHGMIRMYQLENTKILGRGVIDGNGKSLRAMNDTKLNLFKIERSSKILVDGILVRDPSFWNTLIYRSDDVVFQNYKMVNCRPTTTEYNNTDGVNFDESTNGRLTNAFLYTGDDSMATKNEEPSGTINTKNILHEKVVCYSNSVCCKVGTKTMGQSMTDITFRDIDVVKAGRALNIDAYDTAVVENTKFENIRIESANNSMIELASDDPPSWRTAANTSVIKDTYFTNVASDVKKPIELNGRSATVNITGVHFSGLTVQGNPITSRTDQDASWTVNSFVSGFTFSAAP